MKRNKGGNYALVWNLAYFLVYLFSSYTTVAGFGEGKPYWLTFSYIITLLMLYNDISEETNNQYSFLKRQSICVLIIVAVLSIGVFKVWSGYAYVYRDESIDNLKYKIKSGIWKGIYSTELRASNVEGIEQYLKSCTEDNDEVLCLDWASFAYIMINGKMCSPTTLDPNFNSYRINNGNPSYMYFATENKVPNKIIYIDYGRDATVSIDKADWEFNSFVKLFYSMTDQYVNEVFCVRLFEVQDYDNALEKAKTVAVYE